MKSGDRSVVEGLKGQRFLILLVLLLSYFVLTPLFEESPDKVLFRTALISMIFLAAIGCLQSKSPLFVKIRWFGVIAILSEWIPILTESPGLLITSDLFRILFFAGVTVALIYQIAVSREVTLGTILGAIDGYILLGFIAAAAFMIIELASPGSLKSAGEPLATSDIIYYAFITMTTVGYGDIVPVSPAARSLAVLVAVFGQLYIAILISLLVGKYLSTRPMAQPPR